MSLADSIFKLFNPDIGESRLSSNSDGFFEFHNIPDWLQYKLQIEATAQEISDAVKADKRFELKGHLIRIIENCSVQPPEFLFTWVSLKKESLALTHGLTSSDWIICTVTPEHTEYLSKKHSEKAVVLSINARLAWENEVSFLLKPRNIYLTKKIPKEYISGPYVRDRFSRITEKLIGPVSDISLQEEMYDDIKPIKKKIADPWPYLY